MRREGFIGPSGKMNDTQGKYTVGYCIKGVANSWRCRKKYRNWDQKRDSPSVNNKENENKRSLGDSDGDGGGGGQVVQSQSET